MSSFSSSVFLRHLAGARLKLGERHPHDLGVSQRAQ